jgi:hypothetical protein
MFGSISVRQRQSTRERCHFVARLRYTLPGVIPAVYLVQSVRLRTSPKGESPAHAERVRCTRLPLPHAHEQVALVSHEYPSPGTEHRETFRACSCTQRMLGTCHTPRAVRLRRSHAAHDHRIVNQNAPHSHEQRGIIRTYLRSPTSKEV